MHFLSFPRSLFGEEGRRSHVAIWKWVQRFNPKRLYSCKRRVSAFLIDETMLQIDTDEAWLWVAVVEPIHKQLLGVYISRHRNNMIVVEAFLNSLIRIYGGKHTTVYSDGGSWYPEACVSLGLKHRLHSSYEKSVVVERTIEYLKDR